MEERLYLPEGHEGGCVVADGRAAVAREVRDRNVAIASLALSEAHVHPRSAALVGGAAVRIEVEGGNVLPGLDVIHLEETDVVIPHFGLAVGGGHLDVEDALDESEHPVENCRECKVRPELFLGQVELLLLETLAPEGYVPRLKLLEAVLCIVVSANGSCEVRNLGQFLLGGRNGLLGDEIGEFSHGLDSRGHLASQALLGEIVEPEHGRHVLLNREDLVDEGDVVLVLVAEVGRARDGGAVHRLPL
mmetsp:Transcript_25606/g.75575  ORF Transcript_25606/g.75575 Transcript_25606/m.75575 type:complete len:247 (-) Transcript_25606:1002-1742(-)